VNTKRVFHRIRFQITGGTGAVRYVIFKGRHGGRPSISVFAFSLLELLVVIAILAILVSLAVPAVMSSAKANRITIGEQVVTGQLNLARQVALSESVPVQVRFYSYAGESGDPKAFRAIQVFKLQADGSYKPATPVQKLPQNVVLWSSTAPPSTILTNNFRASSPASGDPALSGLPAGQYDIASLDFRSDGSTTLDYISKWHVTLVTTPASTDLPPNFATVQLDPLNGTTRTFRP